MSTASPESIPMPTRSGRSRSASVSSSEDALHVHRGSNRLPGRLEHGQSLVATDLDHAAGSRVDDLVDDVLELRGEARRRLVAVLLGEARIAANVGDQKRLDGRAFFGHLREYRTLGQHWDIGPVVGGRGPRLFRSRQQIQDPGSTLDSATTFVAASSRENATLVESSACGAQRGDHRGRSARLAGWDRSNAARSAGVVTTAAACAPLD
jgi:hypothetical protein